MLLSLMDNPLQFLDEDYSITDRVDEALLFDSKDVAEYYLVEKTNLAYCIPSLFEVDEITVGYEL